MVTIAGILSCSGCPRTMRVSDVEDIPTTWYTLSLTRMGLEPDIETKFRTYCPECAERLVVFLGTGLSDGEPFSAPSNPQDDEIARLNDRLRASLRFTVERTRSILESTSELIDELAANRVYPRFALDGVMTQIARTMIWLEPSEGLHKKLTPITMDDLHTITTVLTRLHLLQGDSEMTINPDAILMVFDVPGWRSE